MWGEPTERLFRQAKKQGLVTSVDTQFPLVPVEGRWMRCFGDLLPQVDLLFTDLDEARAITGVNKPEAAAEVLLEAGPGLVAIKMGAEGALLTTRGRRVRQPAFAVAELKDTIGAGDAFDAGIIYAHLAGWDLERSARFASAVAALTLGGIGGSQTAPTLVQVEEFLASHG
jgi:sugar/nucleoside kinase (ribokinase family)